jgi:predicted phosphodiesterase
MNASSGGSPEPKTDAGAARRIVIVSDTHVGVEGPKTVAADLARLVASNVGAEIVLAGDVFDLSFAPTASLSGELLGSLLDRSPELVQALREHLGAGHPVTIVPGNHDAELASPEIGGIFRARLGVQEGAPLETRPWFVRRGDVHIEHGHAYDPDNAPIHPLSAWDSATEPLGVQLTRHFVARIGAGAFSHAQDSTPAAAIARAFRVYGKRAPVMIAQYFDTAIRLCLDSGSKLGGAVDVERRRGVEREPAFAEATGLSTGDVELLVNSRREPTHLRRSALFTRLYFDRVLATLLLSSSLVALPRRPLSAGVLALGSLAYLGGSWARGRNRYAGLPEAYLREGAARVRELSGARFVVFGHTHREEDGDGYLNTGSFGFPRQPGRPYVVVEADGAVARRRLLAT